MLDNFILIFGFTKCSSVLFKRKPRLEMRMMNKTVNKSDISYSFVWSLWNPGIALMISKQQYNLRDLCYVLCSKSNALQQVQWG